MTATLAGPPPAAPTGAGSTSVAPAELPWRQRILPPTDGRGGWLATLGVVALAGLLRFVRLDLPSGRIFDEIYYVCDAQNLVRYAVESATQEGGQCIPADGPGFVVHPPLGKWAIAVGIRLLGVNEVGWRAMSALAGTLMVLLLVRVTRRMTGSTVLACLAGLLLALDGLHFVQSRIAMLDIFLAFWVLAAFTCLVADRDAVRRRLAATDDDRLAGWGPGLGRRPWLLAAGLCLGAAVATKWSALYYVAVMVLLVFAWEVGARRTAGIAAPVTATVLRSAAPLLAVLVVLPAFVYVLSWAGWFAADASHAWQRDWAASNPAAGVANLVPDGLRSWWQYHRDIFGFHDNLTTSHPYQSSPWGWLVLARPISYYYPPGIERGQFECDADSCARAVTALGTPAIWWAATAALVLLLWIWATRRDWRAGAVLLLVLTAVVPWIRDDLDDRTMFLFYALPAVPFLCLGLALVAGWLAGGPSAPPRRRAAAVLGTGGYLALVVANFAYLYPLLAAQTIPYEQWLSRLWFSSWI
jgi:dolichyl-phosphate-mannose-protein mannosyltransferase